MHAAQTPREPPLPPARDSGRARNRFGDRLGQTLASPWVPWLLAAAFVALGVMVSLKVPLFQGADEGWHYAYVEHYALGRPVPNLNLHFTTGDVAAPYWQTHEASQPPLYYMLMSRLTAWVPRGDLTQEQVLSRGVPNQMYGNYLPADEGRLGTGHALAAHLARLATVLMGAVTVVCAYFITLWLTGQPGVAVFIAALMAFNPRNLVLSGAVSNDMAVAAAASLTLALAVHVVTSNEAPRIRYSFLLGVGAGVSLLMKYSGGAVVVAVAVALVCQMIRSRLSLGWLARHGAVMAVGALLVTGAYFAHNWQLYGDILAWNKVNEMNPANYVSRPLANALAWLPVILRTYFAHPGFISPLPHVYNEAMLYAFVLGLVGAAWVLLRHKISLAYWPLLAALAVNVATYIPWFQARDATQNMRFFSPSFIAITLLVGLGWLACVPRRWHAGFVAVVTVVYGVFTATTLYESLDHIYAFPRYLSDAEALDVLSHDSSGRVRFENGIELVEVQLKNQRIDPGDPIELSIVWRSTRPLDVSAHLALDARDGQNQTAAAFNTGNVMRYSYVSQAWQIGRLLREDYPLVPRAQPGELLHIWAGWYQDGRGAFVRPVDREGYQIEIGRVRIRPLAAATPADASGDASAPLARLDGLADLVSARVEGDVLVLGWRATAEPPKNYTLFVHGLDAQHQIVAQQDEPFRNSAAYWAQGERFEERIVVANLSQARSIRVGVYDAETGQRVRARKPDGGVWAEDSVELP